MKSFKFLSIAVLGLVLLASCNKVTNKNIIGTWNCTSASLNGFNSTPPPFTWVVTFNEGNTGTSTFNSVPSAMVWTLDEKEQKITIPSTQSASQVYDILEYKKNVMRVQYVDGSDTYEYTFEKQ